MEKPINQCWICKQWFIETALAEGKIPDQSGYVKKPICKRCLRDIEDRSSEAGQEANKPKGKLLMED